MTRTLILARGRLGRILGRRTGLTAPQMLTPRWPRGRELGWIIAAGLIFFPLLVPLFLSIWGIPAADLPSSTPAGTYRADRRTSFIYALVYAAAFGIMAGLLAAPLTGPVYVSPAGFTGGPGAGLYPGFRFGLAAVAGAGLIAWLMSGQVPLLKLTVLLLTLLHRKQFRLITLLEDATSRQVLRQAGAVYQFHHAALQSRLAAIHHPQRGTDTPPASRRCRAEKPHMRSAADI